MINKPIHPFPARMAPEIAFDITKELPKNSILLDPMMGSGTTLRIGIQNNCHCFGSDVDPLAILISKTSLTYIQPEKAILELKTFLTKVKRQSASTPKYWNAETEEYAHFWFGEVQYRDLVKLSKTINTIDDCDLRNLYQVALSRCIITKEKGASLASDVSHAKPHKTKSDNNFDVVIAFQQAVKVITSRTTPKKLNKRVNLFSDDARQLTNIADKSVDCIITSPPYLHAVDYFRGHRLSLIWLGYSLNDIQELRSKSIGIQRRPDREDVFLLKSLLKGVGKLDALLEKRRQHLFKYALDIYAMCGEFHRTLKKNRKVTIVIADAWSGGVSIDNTQLIKNAAKLSGLQLTSQKNRQIPANKRYLPPPEYLTNSALDKRMKTEAVLTFNKL